MTAKEKVQELFDKYWSLTWQVHKTIRTYKRESMSKSAAKQCAIIAVSEIKSALISYGEDSDELQNMDSELRWWDEVENELKLF